MDDIQKLKFGGGKRIMQSWRLPEELIDTLVTTAKERNRTVTEVVEFALDQWLQHRKTKLKPKKSDPGGRLK